MRRWLALIGIMMAMSAGEGVAQSLEPPVSSVQPQRGRAAEKRPGNLRMSGELARILDDWAVQQASRALQLDEAKFEQFAPRLRRLQELRRRSQQARNRMLAEIRKLAGPRAAGEPDEAVVRERLNALREHDERAAAEIRGAYQAIDEILTPHQQARFRIFEEALENRKLDLLLRARERAAQPVNPRR